MVREGWRISCVKYGGIVNLDSGPDSVLIVRPRREVERCESVRRSSCGPWARGRGQGCLVSAGPGRGSALRIVLLRDAPLRRARVRARAPA